MYADEFKQVVGRESAFRGIRHETKCPINFKFEVRLSDELFNSAINSLGHCKEAIKNSNLLVKAKPQ